MGFSEVLKDIECSPKDRLIAADVIERNGKILLRLIEDILDISKIEAGKFDIEVREVSVRVLLEDILASFEVRAREKGLLLKMKIDPDVPEKIYSDPVRLHQILCNIIGNSVKFTEKGEITIEAHRASMGESKFGIEFVVKDTGVGLTEEQRVNLFAPFAQADSTVTRKSGGPGLGLALSRRLAEKLGGSLNLLKCDQGNGCSFSVIVANMNAAYMEKKCGLYFINDLLQIGGPEKCKERCRFESFDY